MSCSRSSPSGLSASNNHKWELKSNQIKQQDPVPSDIKISRSVQGKPIETLCHETGISKYSLYGKYMAKVTCHTPCNIENHGYYVVVTGITPTAFGEGKSTVTIGLAQGLTRLKKNTFACIRQPSQGPTFGMKGGAAGGGYSQVWPMDDFNLHLTGDIHAVTAANNLLAAALDARMLHESNQADDLLFKRLVKLNDQGVPTFTEAQKRRLGRLHMPTDLQPDQMSQEQKRKFARLNIDPETINICRVIDTNDRFLRAITIGQAPTENNLNIKTKFSMSVSSELMAILALAHDMRDLHRRIQRIVIGFTKVISPSETPKPVLCDDLCVSGAICALLKDAIHPTIIQTLEGSPVFVHCGPFANIAHGNSSIVCDKIAMDIVGLEGFVVTEAGFGADVGFEKFMNIKCRTSGMFPDCTVLVATVKGIKAIGNSILGSEVTDEEAIEAGLINLKQHIHNIKTHFKVKVVVAINKYKNDAIAHLNLIQKKAAEFGADAGAITDCWTYGGKGSEDLALAVIDVCKQSRQTHQDNRQRCSYMNVGLELDEKLRQIAQTIYGARDIDIKKQAATKLSLYKMNGYTNLPICIAKTQYSISHDNKLAGAPKDYIFPIKDVFLSAGAGFIYALAGDIMTMPGLPTRPAYFDITIDEETGEVDGLF